MDSGNNSSQAEVSGSTQTGVVNKDVMNVFISVFYVHATGIISFFGLIFNIVKIIVFYQQGFKDTINITLFGLAISDTGGLITHLWISIGFNPYLFADLDLPYDSLEVSYLTGGWPHVCFTRITSWITVFATLERCLCIALPLKVKTIITPKRTVLVIVGIFVTMIASLAPVCYSLRLGPKYFPERNVTKIGLVFIPGGIYIESITVSINAFSQLSAFIAVTSCTTILVENLIQKSKWRRSTSRSAKQDSFSNRDKKVVKMNLLISIIFIICLLPGCVNLVAAVINDEYNMAGRYRNLLLTLWGICGSLEALNSTLNIFVYYNMSSKYKDILNTMLHRKK